MAADYRRCACQRVFQVKVHNQRFCSSQCRDRVLGRRKRVGRGTARYDYQQKKLRKRWIPMVQAGNAYCWRRDCLFVDTSTGRWIPPDQPGQPTGWHVGHADHDRSVVMGPEHARCNATFAAVNGNKARVGRFGSSVPRIAH